MPASRVYVSTQSLGPSLTSSATPAVKATLSWTPSANSRWLVIGGCSIHNNTDNVQYIVRLLDPTGGVARRSQGRPDSNLTGVAGNENTFHTWWATLYTAPASPSNISYTLDYALSSNSNNQVLTVADAWIIAIRLLSTDFVDMDTSRTVTSSTTYNSKFNGNLPAGARDYLVITSCSLSHGTGGQVYSANGQILLDGTILANVSPLGTSYVGGAHAFTLNGLGLIHATGGETYNFEYRSTSTSQNTVMEDAFICALDCSQLPNYWIGSDYATTSTSSTTPQPKCNLPLTDAVGKCLLLSTTSMSLSTTATTGRVSDLQLVDNGSLLGSLQGITSMGGPDNDTDLCFSNLSILDVAVGSSHTLGFRYNSEVNGATKVGYSAIAAIQLEQAAIYESAQAETVDVEDVVASGLSSTATVAESVALTDLTALDGATLGSMPEDTVGTGYGTDAGMVTHGEIVENVLLLDQIDNTVGMGLDGPAEGGTSSLIAAPGTVATGDAVGASILASEVLQFNVGVADSLTGGFALTAPLTFSTIMADAYASELITLPIQTTIGEATTLGFGTDGQIVFPIPLAYGETTYVSDFLHADLIPSKRPGEAQQDLGQEETIYLYTLDMTIHGLGTQYFTPHVLPNGVRFDRYLYALVPIEAEGFERNGDGTMPKPKLRIGNVARTLVEYLMLNDDLVSSIVTRKRTLRRYLDDGVEPNPNAFFEPIDIFVIDRKTRQDKIAIEFELTPAIDQDGRQLPARRLIRDTCLWRYRQFDGTDFNYNRVECPYTGTKYFDEAGHPVPSPASDQCGKRLKDCRLRFGINADLPYGGFPGAGKNG